MTDPNVSPYLKRKLRTKAEALADIVPPLEVPRPRDHQPQIDRHMNKPDAVLYRARDKHLSNARAFRREVRLERGAAHISWPYVKQMRREHSKAIATARAYDVLIAERAATRGVLG